MLEVEEDDMGFAILLLIIAFFIAFIVDQNYVMLALMIAGLAIFVGYQIYKAKRESKGSGKEIEIFSDATDEEKKIGDANQNILNHSNKSADFLDEKNERIKAPEKQIVTQNAQTEEKENQQNLNVEAHRKAEELLNQGQKIGMFTIAGVSAHNGRTALYFPLKYEEEFLNLVREDKPVIDFVLDLTFKEQEWYTFTLDISYKDYHKYFALADNGDALVSDRPSFLIAKSLLNDPKACEELEKLEDAFFYISRRNLFEFDRKDFSAKEIFDELYEGYEFTDKSGQKVIARINADGSGYYWEKPLKQEEIKSAGIHVVGVRFDTQSSGCYYYLGDNNIYQIGDRVEVFTSNNGLKTATVVFRKIYEKESELPYDYHNMKTVIRKL